MKKRICVCCLILVLFAGLLGGCGYGRSSKDSNVIKIGYVNPSTGALAGNGEGARWVIDQVEHYVNENGGITVDGAAKELQVVMYDSESNSSKCSDLAQKLIEEDEVDILVAIHTPETVIPVAVMAERYGVPCVAIQSPVDPVAANVAGGDEAQWVFQSFWTIGSVYEVHKSLWTAAGYGPGHGYKVGLTFASDADGTAWHKIFLEKLDEDGYVAVDPGQYPSGSDDFTALAVKFAKEDIDILAGTNIPPDFLKVYKACLAAGVKAGCITMGKCCLLAGDVAALEGDTPGLSNGIMTEVWWTPDYPFTSGLTGISSGELGKAYLADNGRVMPQPAGYAYAGLELAVNALMQAGTREPAAIRDALKATDINTIIGPVRYDSEMLGLSYSECVIAGGQWQDGRLVIIDNSVYSDYDLPIQGTYSKENAMNQ